MKRVAIRQCLEGFQTAQTGKYRADKCDVSLMSTFHFSEDFDADILTPKKRSYSEAFNRAESSSITSTDRYGVLFCFISSCKRFFIF